MALVCQSTKVFLSIALADVRQQTFDISRGSDGPSRSPLLSKFVSLHFITLPIRPWTKPSMLGYLVSNNFSHSLG